MAILNLPIEVVAIYDSAREIKPIRFYRISSEDTNEFIKIQRIIRRDKEKINGEYITTFTCEVLIDNSRKLYDLRYNHQTEEWFLYKMWNK